jgi:hypothetical protein
MHTPEQRDRHELCGSRKKNGDPCRKFAGEGTNHPGIGACKYHGGATKNHQKAAEKKMAAKILTDFGKPIPIEPTAALLAVLHLSAGHLEWIKSEYERTQDKSSFDARSLMRAWNEERDRVARTAKACLDAGVAERQVRLAEEYGSLLAQYTAGLLDDLAPFLSAEGREQVPTFVRARLLALEQRPALTAA